MQVIEQAASMSSATAPFLGFSPDPFITCPGVMYAYVRVEVSLVRIVYI